MFFHVYLTEDNRYAGEVLMSLQLIQALVFFMKQQSLVGQDLLIFEASKSHSDTQHSVRLPSGPVISLMQRPYLTTHNKHKRQTSMSPAGFEPEIPICERLHTHA